MARIRGHGVLGRGVLGHALHVKEDLVQHVGPLAGDGRGLFGSDVFNSINYIIIQNLFCRNHVPTCQVLPHLLLTGLALLNHLLLVGDNLGSDLLTGQQLKCREDQTVKGLAGLAGDALPLLTVLTGLGPLYLLAENSTENMSLECWEEGMVN